MSEMSKSRICSFCSALICGFRRSYIPLSSPHKSCAVAFIGRKEGGDERPWKAWIVETDLHIVLVILALARRSPRVANAAIADEYAEVRGVLMAAVVIGDEPYFGVDGEGADVADPAAVLRERECADVHESDLRRWG